MVKNFKKLLLKELTVDCKDDGYKWLINEKIDIIKRHTKEFYPHILDGELFYLFSREKMLEDKEYICFTSHIDNIPTKHFFKENQNTFKGTFDNSATNASMLWNMLNSFEENVVIAFTGNEEHEMKGVKNLKKYLSQYKIKTFIITDVGYDNYYKKYDAQIEIRKKNKYYKKLKESLQEAIPNSLSVKFKHFGSDESDEFTNDECAFSITLPLKNDNRMHSNKGCKIKKSSYYKYTDLLGDVAKCLK